jgi:DNA (cytosine-5)-methyltransferase 1
VTVARVGSFCSGIGGLDMGAADALGGTHAWFAESDPGASAVLAARFPGVPNHGDLTSFDWSRAEPVDVVCMGFPCQPFSAAGLQLGTADSRHLFPAIVAALEAMPALPRAVVIENVPRLVTIEGGSVWRMVQDELMRLGYAGVWRIAPAASVGAPHLRKRVVLVAQLCPRPVMIHSPRKYNVRSELLKTPTAQLAVNGGSQHPDKRKAGGHGPTLADEIEHLLPTPRTSDSRGAGQRKHGKASGHDLREAISLLPTPRATDGSNGGPNQRGSKGDLALPSAVLHMLPTPTAADGERRSTSYVRGNPTLNGASLPEVFGKYAAAVERWAAVAGPPPPPREVSARGGERLSAKFVEWMNGLPAGFVTGVPGLSNAAVMRCLGNMVVPQFAAAVVAELHTELTTVVNWHLTSGTRAVML